MRILKKEITKLFFASLVYGGISGSRLFRELAKKMSQNFDKEYIWYCPRDSCGTIVEKTNGVFLNEKEIYKCKRCNEEYKGIVLIEKNKHNIRKYVKYLENNVDEEY